MNQETLEGVWVLQLHILNSNSKSITLFMFDFKDEIKVIVAHFVIIQIRRYVSYFPN